MLYAILVLCIYSFKLVLIGVGDSGIRLDDFLIFAAFILLLARGDLRRIKRSRAFNIYLGFVGISLVSSAWNSAIGRVSPFISIIFVVRLLEYMVFYYLGYLAVRNGYNLKRMLSWFLTLLCIVVPLQMAGLVPTSGVFTGITSRAVGNTNGPYEMAVVGAFLLCYLGYSQSSYLKGAWSLFLIVLAASRITFIATVISLTKILLQGLRSRRGWIVGFAAVGSLAVAGFFGTPYFSSGSSSEQTAVLSRLSSLNTNVSQSDMSEAYDAAPVYQKSTDFIDGEFQHAATEVSAFIDANGGDASALQRLYRWTTLIKSALNSLDATAIGLGPSFGSTAVDGYFVRVFIETGVLGLAMFCWFALALLYGEGPASKPFREYVYILLITACFIDIFVSYKPMLLLWLWHGVRQFESGKELHEDRVPNEG